MDKKWKNINPVVWKPSNKGDSLQGVLINKTPRDEVVGIGAKYYIQTQEDICFIWGSTVLDLKMNYVKPGEEVRVTFNGFHTNKRNQNVRLYDVEVAQAPAPESEKADDSGNKSDEDIGKSCCMTA